MTTQSALRFLESALGLPASTLAGTERLRDLETWDSLSTLVLIAAADKELGVPLPGSRVARCETVAEVCALLTQAVAARAA